MAHHVLELPPKWVQTHLRGSLSQIRSCQRASAVVLIIPANILFSKGKCKMKKSLIALAVASALPVAAQADLTISGSVEGKYSDTTWTIESDLDVSVSEVLTNGMTATANVDVSDHQDGNGTAGLSGDFGSMSVGTDSDVQLGADVGDIADQITLKPAAHLSISRL